MTRSERGRSPPASGSSTGCSAAAWYQDRWYSWPASQASASRPCSSRSARRYAARGGPPALIVTGEESPAQVRLRGERTGAVHPALFVAAENDLSALLTHVDRVAPGLLVVDSVQTITSQGVDSSAGAVTQIRAVTSAVIALAKEREIATVLVGHVTKDGSIAGPRVLEHLVDVVLQFEGERHSALRLIRAAKNRYGTADEVGCFEMREGGIAGLEDPSGLFLSDRVAAVPAHASP